MILIQRWIDFIFFFKCHKKNGLESDNQLSHLDFYLGDFKFDKIGSAYNASVPVFALRTVPALTGSMLIPLVYMIMIQLSYSQWTAALAGFLFLFGKNFPSFKQSKF